MLDSSEWTDAVQLTLRSSRGKKHGHWWEVTVVICTRDGVWGQLVSGQGGGLWLGSGYILKVELTELPDRFPAAYER